MADTTVVHPVGNLPQEPKVGENVHGGFRNNVHHNALDALADERGMGRELLRATSDIYPNDLLEDKHAEMMKLQPARGSVKSDTLKVSPWSGKR